jgi:predicted ATPase
VKKTQSYDPIPPVAKEISEEAWLLCFDEFQVRIHSQFKKFEN